NRPRRPPPLWRARTPSRGPGCPASRSRCRCGAPSPPPDSPTAQFDRTFTSLAGPPADPVRSIPVPPRTRRIPILSAPADTLPSEVSDASNDRPADGVLARKQLLPTLIYWGLHVLALGVVFFPPSREVLVLTALTFWVRLLSITAGYHRYFAHRGFKTSRVFQFLLALVGTSATQKGPLWWSGGHRRHHKYSDQPGDMHSPREGFWYAHQGWILDTKWERTEIERIKDFARFPELVWLNRWHFVPPILLAIACAA